MRVKLTIPIEHAPAANRLAVIFDPDTGGQRTFLACELSPTGEAPATHLMASGLIKPEYVAALTNYDTALPILQVLATERNREQPIPLDVETWCHNVIVGEPEGLQRVEYE